MKPDLTSKPGFFGEVDRMHSSTYGLRISTPQAIETYWRKRFSDVMKQKKSVITWKALLQ